MPRNLKLLVDALPLRHGGGVTYFKQQIAALARIAPELSLHSLVSPWADMADLPGTVETVPVRNVPQRFVYQQLCLPWRKTDILYCAANFAPALSRTPTVLTIHDAHHYRRGSGLDGPAPLMQKARAKANHLAMKRATAVVAVSRSLAEEAISSLPEVAEKLHVFPCGRPEWPPAVIPVEGMPQNFVLTVGSVSPHKHLADVVVGWSRSLDEANSSVSLVVVGEVSVQQVAEHRALAGRHAGSLVHLGSIRDRAQMKWLYQNAMAMVSMSTLESLALTPLEARSLGCPVVLSDISAHREMTRGEALFVVPGDWAHLASTLDRVVYRQQPSRNPWTWPHTWEDNAQELLALFYETQMRSRRPSRMDSG